MTEKKQMTDEEIMVGCAHDGSYVAVSVVRQLMAKARQAERESWNCDVMVVKAFENGKAIGRDECLFSNCEKCGETATVRVCNKCFAIERQAGREEEWNEHIKIIQCVVCHKGASESCKYLMAIHGTCVAREAEKHRQEGREEATKSFMDTACSKHSNKQFLDFLKSKVECSLCQQDRTKALETEKEHLIKQVEQLKYGESAGFKYNHSHPYPLCQGCVTEGREEAEKAFTTPIRKYIEAIATQCERIKALEAERTTDTKTMCENAKGMTYWMGEAERYKATLEKVRERLAGFQQEAKCKCEEFDDCYECWVRSEAKDLDKLAKEALGNCGSADGIGCEEQQTTRLSDSKCQRKGSWQPHSKRKNIVSFPTSFGTVSFPKPRKVKKK